MIDDIPNVAAYVVSTDPELALGDVATQRRLKEALQIWA